MWIDSHWCWDFKSCFGSSWAWICHRHEVFCFERHSNQFSGCWLFLQRHANCGQRHNPKKQNLLDNQLLKKLDVKFANKLVSHANLFGISELQWSIEPERILKHHNDLLTVEFFEKQKEPFEESQKVEESPDFWWFGFSFKCHVQSFGTWEKCHPEWIQKKALQID